MGKFIGIKTYERFRSLWENNNIDEFSLNFILDTGQLYTHGIFINSAVFGTAVNGAVLLSIAGVTNTLALSSHTHSNYYDKSENLDINNHKIVSGKNNLLFYSGGALYIGNTSSPTYISGSNLYSVKGLNTYTILDTENFSISTTLPSGYTHNNTAYIKYGNSSFLIDYVKRINTSQSFDYLNSYTQAGTNQLNGIYYGYINFTVDNVYTNPSWALLRINISNKVVEFRTSADTSNWISLNNPTLTWRPIKIEGTQQLGSGTNTGAIDFVAGTGISLSWDSTNKKVTITNTSPDVNHNTDKTGIKLGTVSGTKKTDSTLISANSSTGLVIAGGTNKFSIGNGTNYIEIPVAHGLTTFVKSGSNAAAGLVPAPSTTAGTTKYLREDGTWTTPPNTWKPANTSLEGYAPKLTTGSGTIATQSTEYVLTFNSGTDTAPVWKLLPAKAFQNTWTNFTGATASAAGTKGVIQAPAGAQNKFFRGDNTWLTINLNVTSALYVGASDGTSTSAQSTNGNVYLIFAEGSSYSRYKILGSGRASVTSDANGNITINSSGYSNFGVATASAAGSAGLVPAPGTNVLGSAGYYLRADGTWQKPPNTWKAANTSQEGYVPKSVANKILRADGDGVLYWGDDANTKYSFSNLLFLQTSGTNLMTYNSQAVRTILAGSNITFTHSNNVLTITAKDTTYSTVSKTAAGLCPALPNETTTTKYLRLDGAWVTPPDTNTWNLGSSSLPGYVPLATKNYFLHCNNSTGALEWVANPNTNTWRGIYVEGSSKVGTGTSTLPINFVAGSNVTITYEAAGTGSGLSGNASYFNIKIASTNTWTAWKGATSSAAGTAGYMPAPTAAQYHLFLRGDGTWVSLNNYSLPTASNSTLGGVKTGAAITDTTGYTAVHIKDGIIYYKNTTYSFYNLQFQNSSGTTVDTYKPATSPTKTLKAGSNVTISAASNVITIASTNTWNANTVGVAGYVAAPTKAANANMTWLTDAEGVPAWRASNNHSHSYLPLSGANYNTATDTNPFTISRNGSTTLAMLVMINDNRTLFKYTNDEVSSSIVFQLVNTNTSDGGDGTNASDRNVTISSSNTGISLSVGGTPVSLNGHTHNYLPLSGGQMTGPLTWKDGTALPSSSTVEYILCIDAFANGGTTKWANINNLKTSLGLGSNAYTSTAYLPLSGGTIMSDTFAPFFIQRNHTTYAAAIGFKHYSTGTTVEAMGYIGMSEKDGALKRWDAAINTVYTILDEGNYNSYALPLNGGKMHDRAVISRSCESAAVSWYQGRLYPIIKTTSYTGYNSILSMKTTNGSWDLGVYSSDKAYLTYITDANYNAGTNTATYQLTFPKATGTIALTSLIPTKASWNYDDVYVKSVSISGNNLRINKNGANTDLTIPYASSAGSCSGNSLTATRFAYITDWNSPKHGANIINLMTDSSDSWATNGAPGKWTSGISVVTSYVGFQLATYGGGGETLFFRKLQDDNTWHPWYTIIHSGNIGSQSVNYATTAANISGGVAGSIPYQTASGETAFLAASATDDYVLAFNTSTGAPYWKADANSDKNVKVNNTNPTSGTWYYPVWYKSTGGTGQVNANDGFRYYSLQGTESALGSSYIQIGNATASGTAGNKKGFLRIYAGTTYYGQFSMADVTGNKTYTFNDAGTVLTSGNSSVSLSGQTLTVKINGVEKSLTNTDHYAWNDITGKPSTYTPSSHTHSSIVSGGSISNHIDNTLQYTYHILKTTSGTPATNNNSNAVITINRHEGNYDSQIGFGSDSRLYYRSYTNQAIEDDVTKTWNKVAFTTDNVASASKLHTARTLWGNDFNGTANIGDTIILDAGDSGRQVRITKGGLFLFRAATGGWAGGLFASSNDGSTTLGAFGYSGSGDTLSYLFIGNNHSSPWVTFLPNGRVGVGTISPICELDVSGSANATTLYENSHRVITTANIGSLSVNYANSAGAVAWGNVSSKPGLYIDHGTNVLSYYNGTYTTLETGSYRLNFSGYTGSLIHFLFGGSTSGLDICLPHYDGTDIYIRKTVDSTRFERTSWTKLITTNNIGDSFKTINGQSIVGSGNITISSGSGPDLSDYLAKSGGTMTGTLKLTTGIGIEDSLYGGLLVCKPTDWTGVTSSQWGVGNGLQGVIRSNDTPLIHCRVNGSSVTTYEIIDSKGGQTIADSLKVASVMLEHTNEINSYSGQLCLLYRVTTDINMCVGGGSVGIGTSSPSYKLHVNGDTGASNFYVTSDKNKKQNITTFSEHIRKFQLKDTEKWHYGVIALEVPEMFRNGEEGNMTVNYNSVLSYYVGILENRVKELEDKIKSLETK